MIQEYNCKKNIKVIVKGCFWDIGRSSLYIIDCNFKSTKYRYSAKSYLEVLEPKVVPIYLILPPSYLFLQDNASIYILYKVRDWFQEYSINNITD